jgi:hypothetical protein
MRVAVAISPRATSPADTAPMKIVARLVDSVIAAVRAPCRVKCSVVTNATVVGCGAAPSAPVLAFWSLLVVSPAFRSGFEIYAALPLACRLASDEIRLRQ